MRPTNTKRRRRPPPIEPCTRLTAGAHAIFGGIVSGLIAAVILLCWWLISRLFL